MNFAKFLKTPFLYNTSGGSFFKTFHKITIQTATTPTSRSLEKSYSNIDFMPNGDKKYIFNS